jgi:hypothetical protein
MRADPDWVPAEINTRMAHPARVYDYWLRGKDNFAADRALGDAIRAAVPTIQVMARANRAFLGRAVRFLAGEAGIRQFLDIGTASRPRAIPMRWPNRWPPMRGWCKSTVIRSCWCTRGR